MSEISRLSSWGHDKWEARYYIQDSPPSLMTTKTGLQDLQPQPLGMFLEAADGWEQPLKVY